MPSRRFLAALVFAVALSTVISPFQRDLFVGDETKYGQVIREMRATGAFVVPTLQGRPYSHKPPLHFWIIDGLTYLFGTGSIWPFVIPSLIAFGLLLWVVARIARRMFGEESSLVAALVCATFYLSWGLAQTARMDIGFALLTTIAIGFLFDFLDGGEPRSLWMTGLFVGMAILIKGPMSLVIVLVFLLLERIRRGPLPRGPWIGAFLVAALIPLLWVVPAVVSGGREYAYQLLVKQNVGRAIGSWVHREPFWYYVARFPATFFPWFAIAIAAFIAMFRRRALDPAERSVLRFCFNWVLAVVIPFSMISGKLDVYMLPATIPVALISGRFVADMRADGFRRGAIIANRAVIALVAIVFALAATVAVRWVKPSPEAAMLNDPVVRWVCGVAAVVALLALVFTFIARVDKLAATVIALAIAALAPLAGIAAVLMPRVDELASTRPLVQVLMQQTRDGRDVGLIDSPHLWVRGMPTTFGSVSYLSDDDLRDPRRRPPILVARRSATKRVPEIAANYAKVAQVRMIGKDFDVFRRR